jgi:two-component system response regulator
MTIVDVVDLLIVEDNPNDLELTLRALEKSGLTKNIHSVKDGAVALDFIYGRGAYVERSAAPLPKLILLDLKLPKIDGMEVLRQLKSDARMRSIPVVMLTSSQQERDLAQCYRLGVNSYIVKPVSFSKFTESIRHLGLYWLGLNQPPR